MMVNKPKFLKASHHSSLLATITTLTFHDGHSIAFEPSLLPVTALSSAVYTQTTVMRIRMIGSHIAERTSFAIPVT